MLNQDLYSPMLAEKLEAIAIMPRFDRQPPKAWLVKPPRRLTSQLDYLRRIL
jgi:hypothetical protein